MLTEKKRKKIKIGHKSFSTYIYNIFFKREREREREREQLEENIGIFVNQEKIHS